MSWICAICDLYESECGKNIFCPRTILSTKKYISQKNDNGETVIYYSFSDVTDAMKEYHSGIVQKDNTCNRIVLIEKDTNN